MATLLSFYDNNLPNLITQVNTALTPLLSVKVLAADVDVRDIERRDGIEFRVLIETDTGGAAMSDPFQLQIFTGETLTDATELAQAFIDANPTYFIAPPRLGVISLPRRLLTSFVALFYTEDAANGINNWLAPFVGTAGGGGEVNTASNLAAEGLFASKVGTDLRFKGLAATPLTGLAVASSPTQVTVSQNWAGLPVQGTYPTTGQFIVFNPNGSGDFRTLSVGLVTPPTPGGVNTNVQFNNAGAFGGSADLTWDDTGKVLLVDGKLTVTGLIDPTGVEFTPQLANPGGVAANTIWINSVNNHLYRGAVDLENPAASVTSVFGRTGAVVAVAGDYDSSEVTNVSSVVGATVTAALETLNATFAGYVPTSRTLTAGTGLTGGGNLSADRSFALANTAVTPGSYTNASITVDAQGRITAASSGGGGAVSSVFGRTGAVVSAFADYDSDQIVNNSIVSGVSVSDALNALNGKATPGGSDTSIQYNDGSGFFAGDSALTWNYTNRHLFINQGTATSVAQAAAFSILSEWDSGGTTFRTLEVVFTDTASAAASTPFVISLPGPSNIFSVRKDGQVTTIADFVGVGTTLAAGSAATPSYRFTADPDTGVYSPGANEWAVSTNGSQRLSISTTAVTSTLIGVFPAATTAAASIRLPHGTAPTAPVDGDLWSTTVGFFGRVNGVTVGPFGAGGGSPGGADTNVQFNDGGVFGGDADFTWNKTTNVLTTTGAIRGGDGTVSAPSHSFGSTTNSGMYLAASNEVGIAVSGVQRLSLSTALATIALPLDVTGVVTAATGAEGAPAYAFTADPTTGWWRQAGGTIAYSSSGAETFRMSSIITTSCTYRGPNGTAAAPVYTFSSDTDSGMYRVAADQVGISVGGANVLTVAAAGVTITGKLTVTGLIDPTGLELTPQAANPGGVAANTVWVETGVGWRFDNLVVTPASSASRAGLRLPHGSAPTAPVNGDLWSTTAGFFGRVNGVTVGPFGTGGGGSPGGADTNVQFNDGGSFGGSANLTWDNTTNTLTVAGSPGTIVVGSLDAGSGVILSLESELIVSDYYVIDPQSSNPHGSFALWVDDTDSNALKFGSNTISMSGNLLAEGPDMSVQYNANGLLNGVSNFSWDYINNILTVTGDATIDGKLTVTGLIDPTGMEFTPVAANPGNVTANTVWIDSGDSRLKVGSDTLAYLSEISGSSPGGADTEVQFNNAGSFGGDAGLTWSNAVKTLTITQGTRTAAPGSALAVTGTWNNGAVQFVAARVNITDTASAANSQLLALQIAGADQFSVQKTGAVLSTDGSAAAPSYSFISNPDCGVYLAGSVLHLATDGVSRMSLAAQASTGITTTVQFRALIGSAASPSYAFDGDADTGMYRSAGEEVGFATAGTLRLQISQTTINSALPFYLPAGSAAAPSYSFSTDSDSGLYSPAANEVAIGGDGAQIARFVRTSGIPSLLLGANARLGSERLLVSGGSVPSGIAANDTVVAIGAGWIDAGEGIIGRSFGSGLNAALIARSDSPGLTLYEEDGAADAKMWTFFAFTEELLFRTVNDAASTSNTWLSVARSGASPTRVSIGVTTSVIAGVASLATNATDGFLYVPTCAGTPTGTPTAQTGFAPIVVDSTNNKLYFYTNGAWRDAGP